jgi:hypothetical protein
MLRAMPGAVHGARMQHARVAEDEGEPEGEEGGEGAAHDNRSIRASGPGGIGESLSEGPVWIQSSARNGVKTLRRQFKF